MAVHPCPGCTWTYPSLPLQKQNWLATVSTIFLRHSSPALLSCHPILSANMAPQLNAAQHVLINALLKERFETKLIATKASCTVRAVQRIRLKRQQQSEMPNPQRTKTVSRRSRITPPMQEALCDVLIKQPYLYRCEIADFLYRRFRKRISERSIGRGLRSQRDADLRDYYLHRISRYRSDNLSLWMSLAAIRGLDIGVRGGLRKVHLQSKSQSSFAGKDGTSF